jgi:MFS family permease
MSGASIATVEVIIMCTAEKSAQLLVGRIVTGAGVGVLTSTVGLWQAETTPARARDDSCVLNSFLVVWVWSRRSTPIMVYETTRLAQPSCCL